MPNPNLPTPEEIHDAYMNSEINARQYHHGMWKLSRESFQERVNNSTNEIGVVKALAGQIWDDLKKRHNELILSQSGREQEQALKDEMKRTGKMPEAIFQTPEGNLQRIWNDIQAGFSIVNRPAELTGMGYKNISRALGAPKWMQELIGFAAETAATQVMTGKGLVQGQALASNAVRGTAEAIGSAMGKVAKVTKAAEEVAPAVEAGVKVASSTPTVVQAAKKLEGLTAEEWQAYELEKNLKTGFAAVGKYATPLENKLADFAAESAAKARGVTEIPEGAKLSAGQTRRASHAITQARMENLPATTIEEIGANAPGTMLNAEKTLQAQSLAQEPLTELQAMAKKVFDGDTTAHSAFDAAIMRMVDPLQTIRASETELGRATEILKATQPVQDILAKTHDVYARFSPYLAASGNWEAARRKFAEHILSVTPEQIDETYRRARQVMDGTEDSKTYADLFREVYTSVLLAKPATWVKKASGDVQMAVDKTMQYSFAGWMSPDELGVSAKEGSRAAKALLMSFNHNTGFSIAPELTGATKAKDIGSKLIELGATKGESRALAGFFDYGGDPERWNIPGRVFDSVTSFAQNTGSTFGQYMAAYREVERNGLTKAEEIATFISERMNNPTKEMLMEGITNGGDMTLTNPLGPLGKAVQKAVQGWPGGFLITPFFRIPANIVNRAFSNIPGVNLFTRGLASAISDGTPVERDMALGRLAMAQMSSQYLWLMAKAGMSTGSGPSDPREKKVWMEAGNRPYSFKLGDHWFPNAWLGPLGIQASIVADAAYLSDYYDQPSLMDITASLAIGSAKAISHEPWFEAWGRLAEGMGDPERSGIQNLGAGVSRMVTTPASVLTGGPVTATVARELDPFYKSSETILDNIKENIPWFRGDVPNRLNPLTGEKEPLPAPWGVTWLRGNDSAWAKVARIGVSLLSPVTDVPISTHPVIKEMQRVGATFPNFRYSQGSQSQTGAAPEPGQAPPVTLTAQEQEGLIKQYSSRIFDDTENKTLLQYMESTINDPDYKEAPRAIQQQTLNSLLRANNAEAFNEYKAKNPEVAYRYATSSLKKLLDKAPIEDRDQISKDYLQSVNEDLNATNQDLQAEVYRKNAEDYNKPAYPVEYDSNLESSP